MNEQSDIRQVTMTAQMPADSNILPFIQQKKWLKGKPPWIVLYTGMAATLGADKEFNLTDLRTFLALLDYVDFENVVDVSQSVLSKRLNIAQTDISKSLKKLINKGYIEIFEQRGKQNIYRLNPYVVVKGRGSNLEQLEQEFAPIKQL